MSPRRIRSYPKLSSGKMGHSSTELNAGFGFVIYGGTTAAKSAMKAVEFDGVEFHGRVLTVKLDAGRRLKDRTDERARWLEGYDGVEYRSQWHKERESSRNPRIGKQLFGNVCKTQNVFFLLYQPSRGEYGLMVKYYARQGDMHRARETFASMRARAIEPSSHGWRNEKNPRDFDMMRMSGCIPTVHTLNALVLGLMEKRQMQKAVEILDGMTLAGIIPDEHTYTTIMPGYASLGDTGKAFECFTKLRSEGLELDVFTYEALLKACCKAGRMQSALAVTTEMSAKNIPRNAFIYNILIDGWARRGDVWEAADLMHQMKKEGVRPDIHTYTSFINASCKAGDMQRAEQIIEDMEALGVKPNVKTYTTLIKGWARASLPEKALRCFKEMKLTGLKPDRAVYHCLMTSLLSRATVAEVYIYTGLLSICKEMIESGVTIDIVGV
ncbi:hypothetical protein EV2_028929 [Malus domestica]